MQLSSRADKITPSSTLAITAQANQLKAEGHDVIGLAAGEPDFNTPAPIIESAYNALKNGATKYTPSGGMKELKEAIKEKFSTDQGITYKNDQLIVTTGAKHALYLAFQAMLDPGDEVLIPTPYWVSYPEQVKLAGGSPVFVTGFENNQYKITPDQLKAAITDKTKAVIINSPSNPTGMIYSEDELEAIGEVCVDHRLLIISDEIYEKLVYDGKKAVSIATLSDDLKKSTLIVNGLSKSHAMTGWRVGYAAGEKDLISAMTKIASHSTSNPATVSQHAAVAAYHLEGGEVEHMREAFEERLNYAYERLINIPGISCIKPKGAFYLFPNVKRAVEMTGYSSTQKWAEALLDEAKVALVPGDGFGAPDCARLSYATSLDQLKEALDRIYQFMEKHLD